MAGQLGEIDVSGHLELAAIQPLASSGSLFTEGFASPWQQQQNAAVPWTTVQQLLAMARDALTAKQQAAEVLLGEIDRLKTSVDGGTLLQRAQRAEVDSRLLLEELQGLMQAKADVAQQRADLDRANTLLMAERELLCEQLDVSPDNINLCQAVQKVLAAAKRAQGLEGQLRMLARCQRDLLLQLEASREQEARAARHWQACEQVYIDTLAAHGIQKPELPLLMQQHSGSTRRSTTVIAQTSSSGGVTLGGSSSSCQSHSITCAHALSRLKNELAGIAAASAGTCNSEGRWSAGVDGIAGSPASHAHLLPSTPPASDMNLAGGPLPLRRSHSLDSGLHNLTGLLEQLALGQPGSEDLAEYDYDESYDSGDCDHWTLVDTMSDEAPPGSSATRDQASESLSAGSLVPAPTSTGAHEAARLESTAAASDASAATAATVLLLGGTGNAAGRGHAQQLQSKHLLLQQQQLLQTVEEVQEDQDSTDVIAAISS